MCTFCPPSFRRDLSAVGRPGLLLKAKCINARLRRSNDEWEGRSAELGFTLQIESRFTVGEGGGQLVDENDIKDAERKIQRQD